jgi:hypothetical protein
LHHAANYAVGGTFIPANAVADYFHWPGCPFTPKNMTGGWKHDSLGHLALYAAALLLGKQGFIGQNLPLFLAVPGLALLVRRRTSELPEVLFAGFWCGGTWLMYAVNSTNYSGVCCSVRWFVPLLAPAYYALALLLRDQRRWRGDFLLLSSWGIVFGLLMWWRGPWARLKLSLYWPLLAAALLSWLAYCLWLRLRAQGRRIPGADREPRARAA